jgi:membrane associated rhomboid family serine protease
VTTLRLAEQRGVVEQWALVLNSQGLHCGVQRGADGWNLVVDPRDAERGARLLEAYDLENRLRDTRAPAPEEYGSTWAGFGIATLLVAFHFVVTRPDAGVEWLRRGSASAELILRGEWWRSVTALTLHADILHLVANAASCALFATAFCRAVGPGVGAWLILAAGASGNLLTALVHGSDHVSVGASTAIFGALGLLAGQRVVGRRRSGSRAGRAWAPLAAALGLLAMLGTGGVRTDLLAHVFGLASGVALGIAAGVAIPRPPGQPVQSLLLASAALAVVLCWSIALA